MISKLVGLFLMPAGLLGILLVVATVLSWRRSAAAGRWMLGITLLFWLSGNARVGHRLIGMLEQGISRQDPVLAGPFDAVYVLGGGTELDALRRPELNEFGDRVVTGAILWHAGRTKLLVAGGMFKGIKGFERNLGEETRTLWLRLGVPDAAIRVATDTVVNTREEILMLERMKAANHWQRVGLVSSAFHLPRAIELSRAAGLAVEPIGSDWRSRVRPFQLTDLVPQEKAFRNVQLACWELIGRLVG